MTATDRQAALFRAWLAAGGTAGSWVEAQRRMRILLGDPRMRIFVTFRVETIFGAEFDSEDYPEYDGDPADASKFAGWLENTDEGEPLLQYATKTCWQDAGNPEVEGWKLHLDGVSS